MQAGVIEVCDFCETQVAGEILIEAQSLKVHICERCVALCAEVIEKEKACAPSR